MQLCPRSAAAALRSTFQEDKQPEFKLDYYNDGHNTPLLPTEHGEQDHLNQLFDQPKPDSGRRVLPTIIFIVLITSISFAIACVHYQTFTTLFLYLAILIVAFPLFTFWRLSWMHKRTLDLRSTLFGSILIRLHYLLAIIWVAAIVELVFFQPVISGFNDAGSALGERRPTEPNVFIASNLYNNENILPAYSESLKQLVHLIGTDNVYVSIYESHSKDKTKQLLRKLDQDLSGMRVGHRILSDDRAIRQNIYSPGPSRIDFLAQVRNIAMEPFAGNTTSRPFTHVLWINDVLFDPKAALNLLGTNDGDYDQVCAIDYIGNGFYDTWVTRDIDDNTLKRNWPYFSRKTDIAALRAGTPFLVNSCWNGMTVFAAKWFTQPPSSFSAASSPETELILPLKFRSSSICFSSECQLASYDLHRALSPLRPRIYINPTVQVAYRRAHYFMYNTLIPSPLSRVWRKVWRDWISFRLFGWLSESRRWINPCKHVFTLWAAPDAPLAH